MSMLPIKRAGPVPAHARARQSEKKSWRPAKPRR
jgi:hypothetical protein